MTTPPNPFANVPPPASLRVLVADDNPVVRAGLTALLTGREDITVVAEAADGREACEAAHTHRPDVVLLDVRMPGVDGISALPYLVRIAPVVMLFRTSLVAVPAFMRVEPVTTSGPTGTNTTASHVFRSSGGGSEQVTSAVRAPSAWARPSAART